VNRSRPTRNSRLMAQVILGDDAEKEMALLRDAVANARLAQDFAEAVRIADQTHRLNQLNRLDQLSAADDGRSDGLVALDSRRGIALGNRHRR
jgi:hypothetical protein